MMHRMNSEECGQNITSDSLMHAQWPRLDSPPPSPVSSASTTSSSAGRTSHTSRTFNSRCIFQPSQKYMSSTQYTMWIGNIPSNATEGEILTFCRQPFPGSSYQSNGNGILSVFLISYTNCAFVNLDSEKSLLNALKGINHRSLRPHDPECPPLVCKLRTKGDERHAGVNLQRGTGLHVESVNAKRRQRRIERLGRLKTIDPTRLAFYLSDISEDDDDLDSDASTTSSLLRENFQTRYFILKASDEEAWKQCLESGRWITQLHNEVILDQAFRTSSDVILIFGVNKSGMFQGYARMSSRIEGCGTQEHLEPPAEVETADEITHIHPLASVVQHERDAEPSFDDVDESDAKSGDFYNLRHSSSAQDLNARDVSEDDLEEIPPRLSDLVMSCDPFFEYNKLDKPPPPRPNSTDPSRLRPYLHRAQTDKSSLAGPISRKKRSLASASNHLSASATPSGHTLTITGTGSQSQSQSQSSSDPDRLAKGDPALEPDKTFCLSPHQFCVSWLSTKPLPFYRTKRFLNPWNNNRSIKISRDGTELETGIGEGLIREWRRYVDGARTGTVSGGGKVGVDVRVDPRGDARRSGLGAGAGFASVGSGSSGGRNHLAF